MRIAHAIVALVFLALACSRAELDDSDGGSGGGGGGFGGVGGGTAGTGGGGGSIDGGRLPVGSACTGGDQCQFAPGDTIHQYTPVCLATPGGYCALPCHDGFGCWAGMSCTSQMQCLKSCTADSDCRASDGYSCCDGGVNGGGLCEPSPCH